jgi:serine/threonine protein kinase
VTIAEGTRLGRYEIRRPIGSGGMGEVYMAQDVRLERTVALKILPEGVSTDQQRMRRFEQEARAASALNHPNVTHIYEIEEENGYHFIAMEYIEGNTLRQHMAASPLRLHEALDIAQQITAALSAAHAAGIIHRDIKPENVMIRRDGYVKVLDFGLAKLTERHSVMDTEAPTRALVNTGPGMVMGTARYMSPEQSRGLEVDARTDLWSLGVVLYECVAGRPPFEGSTASDVISAILSKEPPPLARYARDVPESLEWIVTKALTKDRDERYQTAREMLVDLRRVKQKLEVEAEIERSVAPDSMQVSSSTRSVGPPPVVTANDAAAQTAQVSAARTSASSAEYIGGELKRHRTGLLVGLVSLAVIVVAVVVALVGYGLYRIVSEPLPNQREQSSKQTGARSEMKVSRLTSNGKIWSSSISPDSRLIACGFTDEQPGSLPRIALLSIEGGEFTKTFDMPVTASGPIRWSADGKAILYRDTRNGVTNIWSQPVEGGPPKQLTDSKADQIFDFNLSRDGKQLAVARGTVSSDVVLISNFR